MSESLLLMLSKVFANRINYCIICLRTDKERGLQRPKHIKKLMESINQPYCFEQPFQKVCFVCEQQAAKANRLLISTIASIHAHNLSRRKTPSQFMELENALEADPDVVPVSRPFWLSQMMKCESKLLTHREKTQLLQTEMQLISSDNYNMGDNSFKDFETRDNRALTDRAPRNVPQTCDLNNKDKIMESIIILDEDDIDIPAIPLEIQGVHSAIQSVPSAIQSDSKNTKPRNYPQINLKKPKTSIQKNQLLTGANIPIQSQITVQNEENIRFVTDPKEIYCSAETNVKHPSKSFETERESWNKVPKLRMDRIDWEDKIPMDVISFFNEESERDLCKRPHEDVTSHTTEVVDLCTDVRDDSPPLLLIPRQGRPRKNLKNT